MSRSRTVSRLGLLSPSACESRPIHPMLHLQSRLFALGSASLLALSLAFAQGEIATTKLATIEFKGTPVQVAVKQLFNRVQTPYKIVGRVHGVVTITLQNVTFEEGLKQVLAQANADAVHEDGKWSIRSKERRVVHVDPHDPFKGRNMGTEAQQDMEDVYRTLVSSYQARRPAEAGVAPGFCVTAGSKRLSEQVSRSRIADQTLGFPDVKVVATKIVDAGANNLKVNATVTLAKPHGGKAALRVEDTWRADAGGYSLVSRRVL